jgi:hypothetical protein
MEIPKFAMSEELFEQALVVADNDPAIRNL